MITYYILTEVKETFFWWFVSFASFFIKTHNFIEIKLIFTFTIDNEYNMLYNYLYMK